MDKDQFQKIKKTVQKKYPNAKTIMDQNGKYYVSTEDGRDICNIQVSQTLNSFNFDKTTNCNTDYEMDRLNSTLNKVCIIPHSDSVIGAWKQVEVAIRSYYIVNRNNGKFNDEKIMKKIAEDYE